MMRKRLAFGAALLVTAAMPLVAFAQTAGGSDQPASDNVAFDQVGIPEIIVTAQRRAESSQKAGIAISVIQPDLLLDVTRPDQLTKLAPALQIGTGGSSSVLLYVRGVGTFSANPYTDSAVALNYDGVYLGRPTSSHGLFYDLERIEVLKGPQGTLYGRNATGGALNVIPAQPKLGVTSMDMTASGGNYGSFNMQAAANIPVSDTVALRVAGVGYTHDGYLTAGQYDGNGIGGRAQLLVKPSETFSIRIAADYFQLGGTGAAASLYGALTPGTLDARRLLPTNVSLFDPQSIAILNSPTAIFAPSGAPTGPLSAQPRQDNKYYGVNAEINADLGFANLTVIPAYRESRLDIVGAGPLFQVNTVERDKQFSVEARLDGKIGPVDWLVGAFYFDETVDALFNIGGNLYGGVQTLDASNASAAGFGRLTFNVSDRFRLTAAGRYTEDTKSFDGVAVNPVAICTSPTRQCPNVRRLPGFYTDVPAALNALGYIQPPGSPVYIDALGTSNVIWNITTISVMEDLKQNKFTYRAAAEFDVAPQSMLYASVETGYRSGGFSFSTIRPTFNPETITAYTLGMKNRFLNNKIQFNIESFVWKYKDQQLSHSAIGLGGSQEFVTENVGDSTSKGIEIEFLARPWQNTTFNVDLQYLDAKLDNFSYVEPDQSSLAGLPGGTIRPTTACAPTFRPTLGNYLVDCSGQRALRSPKWTINLGIAQVVPLSDRMDLQLSFNTHYQTRQQLLFERLAIGVESSYWLSDASVGIAGKGDRANWSLTAYVNNIENYRAGGSIFLAPNGLISSTNGTPRRYGLRAQVSF